MICAQSNPQYAGHQRQEHLPQRSIRAGHEAMASPIMTYTVIRASVASFSQNAFALCRRS